MINHTIIYVKGFSQLASTIESMELKNFEVAGIASDDGDFAIVFKPAPQESPKPVLDDSNLPESLDDLAILQGRHFGE